METGTVRLPAVSRADSLELGEFVDGADVSFEEGTAPGMGTAVVAGSFPALRGLVAYLAYRHRGTSFEQAIEVERPDGTRVRETITWHDSSAEAVDAAVARELSSYTGIPVEQLFDEDD